MSLTVQGRIVYKRPLSRKLVWVLCAADNVWKAVEQGVERLQVFLELERTGADGLEMLLKPSDALVRKCLLALRAPS